MKRLRGTVKNSVIVMEKGVHLPESMEVEIRLPNDPEREAKKLEERNAAIQRILDHQITHPVGMAEIIEEDKRERENHWWNEGDGEK